MSLTPTVVWRVTADLVRALDERLGPPLDGYVNGTQTWLTADDGKAASGDVTLEWRLHPVAGFEPVPGISHEDLWDTVAGALADEGADPAALPLGDEHRALASLWDGLECFPAYGDEVEPQVLAGAVAAALGIGPDIAGLVDHERIGLAWERAHGKTSIVDMLLADLEA